MQKLSLFSGGWWRRLRAWVAMFQTAWTAIHTPSSSPNSTEQLSRTIRKKSCDPHRYEGWFISDHEYYDLYIGLFVQSRLSVLILKGSLAFRTASRNNWWVSRRITISYCTSLPNAFVCPHFEGQLHLSIWVPGKGWIYIIYFYYYAKYFQTGDPGRLNDGPAWDGHSAECKEDETGPPTLCSCQQAR